jgi:hypothetical protein
LGLGARALPVVSRGDGATVSTPKQGDFCKNAETRGDDVLYMPLIRMVIDFNHQFNSHLREFSIRARSVLDKIVFWKESM